MFVRTFDRVSFAWAGRIQGRLRLPKPQPAPPARRAGGPLAFANAICLDLTQLRIATDGSIATRS